MGDSDCYSVGCLLINGGNRHKCGRQYAICIGIAHDTGAHSRRLVNLGEGLEHSTVERSLP